MRPSVATVIHTRLHRADATEKKSQCISPEDTSVNGSFTSCMFSQSGDAVRTDFVVSHNGADRDVLLPPWYEIRYQEDPDSTIRRIHDTFNIPSELSSPTFAVVFAFLCRFHAFREIATLHCSNTCSSAQEQFLHFLHRKDISVQPLEFTI